MITVVGSVNLDFVASGKTLPKAGETVTGARLASHPGGLVDDEHPVYERLPVEYPRSVISSRVRPPASGESTTSCSPRSGTPSAGIPASSGVIAFPSASAKRKT